MQPIANYGIGNGGALALTGTAIRHGVPWKRRTIADCIPKTGNTDLLMGGMIQATIPANRFSGTKARGFIEAGDPEPGVGYGVTQGTMNGHEGL